VGTLKVRLMRGRARLRDRLVRRGLASVAAAFAAVGYEASAFSSFDAPVARIGTVSARAAALARTTSRSLFMARVTTIASAVLVAGGILFAAGWGLRASVPGADAPPQAVKPAAIPKDADGPPNYNDRMNGFQMATIGNMGPAVEDKERGLFRTESREAILKKGGDVWIWNVWEKTLVAGPLRHEDEPITSIDVLDGAKLLLTKSGETMRVWDALTGKFKGQMTAQHVAQSDFNCHQEVGRLITISKDNQTITIYDPDNLKPLASFKSTPHDIVRTAVSQNGKTLATFGEDRTIQLWDLASKKAFVTLEPPSAIAAAMFKENGRLDLDRFTDSWEFWRLVSTVMPRK
jgi:hypothetical protein